MKRRVTLLPTIICFPGAGTITAAGAEIGLDDGSVIRGEIVAIRDSVYTIRTDSPGTVTVAASRIQKIRMKRSTR